jgi:hypothetical protein
MKKLELLNLLLNFFYRLPGLKIPQNSFLFIKNYEGNIDFKLIDVIIFGTKM